MLKFTKNTSKTLVTLSLISEMDSAHGKLFFQYAGFCSVCRDIDIFDVNMYMYMFY